METTTSINFLENYNNTEDFNYSSELNENGQNVKHKFCNENPYVCYEPELVYTITVIYAIIFILGQLGNIITSIVIAKNKSMHIATNGYLFNLAISNMLFLISSMPYNLDYMWRAYHSTSPKGFRIILNFLAESSINSCILTLCLLTIVRYIALAHPMHSYKFSKISSAVKHVCFIWIMSAALSIPSVVQKSIGMKYSVELVKFLVFMLSMILMALLYAVIVKKIYFKGECTVNHEISSENLVSLGRIHKRPKRKSTTKTINNMLMTVVLLFFVCWAPSYICRLLEAYGLKNDHKTLGFKLFKIFSGLLSYTFTVVNPMLYSIMSENYRKAFKRQWQIIKGKSLKTPKRDENAKTETSDVIVE